MSDPWSTEIQTAPPPRKGLSPGAIVALAGALLVLAVGGAAIGWTFADSGSADDPNTAASASVSPAASATNPVGSPTPTDAATNGPASPVASAGDLAGQVIGAPFLEARALVRSHKMQAVLKFDGAANGTSKVLSVTPPDVKIAAGTTVTLVVSGVAPVIPDTELENVIGQPCRDAGSKLAQAGLIIKGYAPDDKGVLLSVNPALTGLRYNTEVELTCGAAETSPSPAGAP